MTRTHAEIAKAQLADVDKRNDWQTAVRELRQIIVEMAAVLDDLNERVESLGAPGQ